MSSSDQVAREAKAKSPLALKTISEAADMLDVPQHVLRFWETKFSQIKPLKRNGGRRYYRPDDIETLQVIKNLLYKQGFTIKGAKKAFEKKTISELTQSFSEVAMGQPTRQDNDNHASAAPAATAAVADESALLKSVVVDLDAVKAELSELSSMLRERRLS